jgi:hypothetical protein
MSKTILIQPMETEISELTKQSKGPKLSSQTLARLKKLQRVICFEEGRYMSVNDVLDRILTFYRQFVPFD